MDLTSVVAHHLTRLQQPIEIYTSMLLKTIAHNPLVRSSTLRGAPSPRWFCRKKKPAKLPAADTSFNAQALLRMQQLAPATSPKKRLKGIQGFFGGLFGGVMATRQGFHFFNIRTI